MMQMNLLPCGLEGHSAITPDKTGLVALDKQPQILLHSSDAART